MVSVKCSMFGTVNDICWMFAGCCYLLLLCKKKEVDFSVTWFPLSPAVISCLSYTD